MQVIVVASESLKEEMIAQGLQEGTVIEWASSIPASTEAGCCIDLLFEYSPERVAALKRLQPAIIIVNSVPITLDSLPENFVRINGWPGFLQRKAIEASSSNVQVRDKVDSIFSTFNKSIEWVPDKPGFITATIISMIINEAYFAFGEQISSKEDIDTAMKLGTNYPFGPFEWGKKIGLQKVHDLLFALSQENLRYQPAKQLTKEVLAL